MNAERLLQVYEQISEAPDAIARLRRFVLDLAVRGKLVEQVPEDEPASQLLERIKTEKDRIVREGKFKNTEGSFARDQEAFAFPLPASWHWCYLDDVAAIARGGSPRPIKAYLTDEENGIPWIKIGDSTRGSIHIDSTAERIKPEGLSKSRLVVPGDLLLSNSMSFGFPYITNVEGCIHDGWLVIRTPDQLMSKLFLHTLFLSEHAKQSFAEAASGAVVQNLNADKVRRLTVPLPPLAEQHRIVAKVDELMALCDRLEEARKTREELRDKLTAASLARLTAPDTMVEDFPTHAAFALEALPALTTHPDRIKPLRQTILNLAVRGKLVEQDAADEPASTLIKVAQGLQAERGAKVKVDPIQPSEVPFHVPFGWLWTRIGTIALQTGSGSTPRGGKSAYAGEGTPFLRSQNIYDDGLRLDDVVFINDETNKKMKRTQVKAKDLLLNITGGSIGRCTRVPDEFPGANVSQHVAIIRTAVAGIEDYLHLLIRSPFFQEYVNGEQTGAGRGGLPKNRMDRIPVPLPPLAEQSRILAKVDTLMALCDRLEAALTTTDTTRTRLLESLLHESLEPAANALEAAE
ncbi:MULTISPECIES: restriction endonuclease subunit S [unclassified Sulfitobacter]|uniref:restriction endonuclease subunit S n=1 Tax=unclassified Sulfitobacter TaxID=196795 RepID=UPI00068E4DF7|nr:MULTISPECIES: restriction endonuclease subunit S [unclassified Sulfitobacter]PTA98373.1 restriction endonuclease subunit S [Sulfitobacter sp. CB-A]ULO19500.1 restriction endonuclease subunit S [Sulfitobacter sp. CB2047]